MIYQGNLQKSMIRLFVVFIIIPFSTSSFLDELNESTESKKNGDNWKGRWFPKSPGQVKDPNPIVPIEELHDSKHGIKMGVASADCDDASTLIEVDWFNDPVNYTCYEDKSFYLPDETIRPIFSQDYIPKGYNAPHKCMKDVITYRHNIPTFGPHRPLWAKWGEYRFLPKQRWLHNLEHGGIVMLYHPCANSYEMNYLKDIVTDCLYRHVITPYNLLTEKRPLALVAWGRRLEMSKVDPKVATDFIKKHAKHGPEHTHKQGQYGYKLIKGAEIVSDKADSTVCPGFQNDAMK